MLPDRVSNPGPLTYESGALPIALRGPACLYKESLNDKLLKDALIDNINMMNSGKGCWLTCVSVLRKFNLVHLFHRPLKFTNKHLAISKRSLQGKFVNKWTLELNRGEKSRTYRQFKSACMYEKYLPCVSNDSDRRNLSRFRTSSHRLQFEIGILYKVYCFKDVGYG